MRRSFGRFTKERAEMIELLSVPSLTTIQDLGRYGYQ
ncbi:MAG TPA: urea amidolyase, partial [Pyrodictium sp.]|nr:urea amidolyase [Pyrodictium sp.]